ncbi:hypothetical protein N7G274_004332 [Stereocaulon virgatum]|uniref:Uncharacterized protein n=1 Tax=Stereocaulon virgatum TaxID=373712 RepID=A0ABR4ABX9_9LECA
MYDKTMKRIEGQENDDVQLAKMTSIPLTALELRQALAIERDTVESDEKALPDGDLVISVCGGLVIINQETDVICLTHYTTQEYLKRHQDEHFPTAQRGSSRTCLIYLSLNVFFSDHVSNDGEQVAILERNIFLDYASRSWDIHAAGESEDGPNIQ